LQPERGAKAELNRRSQACEVLADTGIRVARNAGKNAFPRVTNFYGNESGKTLRL